MEVAVDFWSRPDGPAEMLDLADGAWFLILGPYDFGP